MAWSPKTPKTLTSIGDVAKNPSSGDAWKDLLIDGSTDMMTGGAMSAADMAGLNLGKLDPRTALSGGINGGKILDDMNGENARKPYDAQAQGFLDKETAAYDGITAPQLQDLALQGHTWQQDLTPEQVAKLSDVKYKDAATQQAIAQAMGPSAMTNVGTDPALRAQQSASLGALKDLSAHGGMNLTDQANLARIQSQTEQANRGRQDAILQNMHARGMGGSGQELMAQLQSSQAATDQQGQQGLDVAAQAQARALQAMMQGGQMAGDMRNQDFSEQARVAAAKDAAAQFNAQQATGINQYNAGAANAMNQFNTGNQLRTDVSNRDAEAQRQASNAAARTQANLYNNQGRQGAANSQVDTANQAATYNTTVKPGAQFGMDMNLAGAKGKAAAAGQNYWTGVGNRKQGIRQGQTDMLTGAAGFGYNQADKNGYGIGGDSWGSGGEGSGGAPGGNMVDSAAKMAPFAAMAAHGGFVPGRATAAGDSAANDDVPTLLSPGEAVLPRSVMAHPDRISAFLKNLKPIHNAASLPPSTADQVAARLEAIKSIAKRGKK